jgi:colanic acid/amylovoran biosynthesis glycosyltransferase
MKIGVLIPEFPGQTHAFFWRELAALRGFGVEPEVVSTRRPPRGIVSHAWAREAMERTVYLSPPSAADLAGAGVELARGLPGSALRVGESVVRARGLDLAGRLRLVGLATMGARLARLARERGWGHVHAHSCADAAHVAMFAKRVGGPTYSMTLHGPLADYGPNQREKWRYAAFAIVITQKLLGEVRAKLAGDLPPIIEVAPMGVDTDRFVRSEPYAPWDGRGTLRLFSCGRLNPCKGHGDLARAVGILRARGIDARLEIAGEDEQGGGGFHVALAREIAAAGLGDAVTLLGAVSEPRVRAGLERAHVFALASLAEPLGVAIMEAMSLGTPVVVTGAGGVPELVRDGEDGLLVTPERADAMADAVERVARDPAFAQRLARSGRERVVAAFDSTRSAQVLARLIVGAPSRQPAQGLSSPKASRTA